MMPAPPRPLTTSEALDTWEAGRTRHPVDRAVLLAHGAAIDGGPPATEWSVGTRDAALVALRQAMFGDAVEAVGECPACGESVEVPLRCSALLDAGETAPGATHELHADGHRLRFRLPDSRDLAAIATLDDVGEARGRLVARCVLHAEHDGEAVATSQLPEEVVLALAGRMAELDPCAEVLLRLTCPACAHGWEAIFDIGPSLWAELDAHARRLVLEVDALARAYGWTEAEVLRLSPARRSLYLEMASR